MKRIFIIFLILISCQERQQEKSNLNDCLNDKQVNLLNEMISSFENDVCKYYNYPKNESEKAIKEYLNASRDFKDASILLKIASSKSKQLLKKSFNVLSDDIWITYKEKYSSIEESIPILTKGELLKDRLEKDKMENERLMKKYKNKHYLRIYGEFINCLNEKSSNETAKKLYDMLSVAGDINPIIVINGLIKENREGFNSKEVKIYIALELFYSPLDFNLK